PSEVVTEFVGVVKAYGIHRVTGDRYAGEWARERFREHDVSYDLAEKTKSEIYLEVLPQVNSGRVELVDHARLRAQLCTLERRSARGGRDTVDHAPGGHDDLINAAAGALVLAAKESGCQFIDLNDMGWEDDTPPSQRYINQIKEQFPQLFPDPDGPLGT